MKKLSTAILILWCISMLTGCAGNSSYVPPERSPESELPAESSSSGSTVSASAVFIPLSSSEDTAPAQSSQARGPDAPMYDEELDGLAIYIDLPEGMYFNIGPGLEGQLIVQNGQVAPEHISPHITVPDSGVKYNGIPYVCMYGNYDNDVSNLPNRPSQNEYDITVIGNDITMTYSATREEPYTYCYMGDDYVVEHRPPRGVGGPFSSLYFVYLPLGVEFIIPFPPETPAWNVYEYYSGIFASAEMFSTAEYSEL